MAAMRLRSWLEASPPLRPAARASSEENSCADPFSWAALPPLLPAERASSELNSCADPFWCAACPPLLAISRCFASSMEPKPRLPLTGILSPPFNRTAARRGINKGPRATNGIAAINLADTVGWLSGARLQTETRPALAPRRGRLLRSSDPGTQPLVARWLLAAEEGTHPLPEGRPGAIGRSAAPAVRPGGCRDPALASDAGILLTQLLVLAAQIGNRRFACRHSTPHRSHADAVNQARVGHVEQEQATEHDGGKHYRNPVGDRGPVPLPERDVMCTGVPACGIDGNDPTSGDQEQQE